MDTDLQLENRHTGEWLRLRRIRDRGQVVLEIEGGLPSHRAGPPLHIHLIQHEDGAVLSGEGEVERSAFCIHAPIHRLKPRLAAAFHTHMPYASALANGMWVCSTQACRGTRRWIGAWMQKPERSTSPSPLSTAPS